MIEEGTGRMTDGHVEKKDNNFLFGFGIGLSLGPVIMGLIMILDWLGRL